MKQITATWHAYGRKDRDNPKHLGTFRAGFIDFAGALATARSRWPEEANPAMPDDGFSVAFDMPKTRTH